MFSCAQAARRSPCAPVCVSRKARGVQRKAVADGPTSWSHLATSIRVSKADEASEREADRVAELVTRRDTPAGVGGIAGPGIVQRVSAGCDEDGVHRLPDRTGYLSRLEGRGHPLPPDVHREFAPRFGRDFSNVRVHTGGEAADSARDFGALAYTYDRHVVFGAGQFDAASSGGRKLIAHELAHVVQQSGSSAPASVQRKGPFDLQPDLCVTAPGLGTVCGSGAAKLCGKMPSLPGCSAVCKIMDCPKSTEPTTICPPGWQGTTARGFEDQCCQGTTASAQACCPPGRIAINESVGGRCCGADEVVVNQHCVKTKDLPTPTFPTPCLPPSRPNLLGKCCVPPEVPQGITCEVPFVPTPVPPPTPTPKAVPPVLPPIFFNLDRPSIGESLKSFDQATTKEGKANFDALVKALTDNPALKVHLVGRASPEAGEAYNFSLGGRRAQLVADALKAAGISESRIADAPSFDPGAGCTRLGDGLSTCGKTGATGEKDRQVLLRLHGG